MAKLKPPSAAPAPAPAPPAPVTEAVTVASVQAVPVTQVQAPVNAPIPVAVGVAPIPVAPVATQTAAPVPFAVAAPGQAVPTGDKPGLAEKRAAKVAAAVSGKTFAFKEEREQKFSCICGSVGKNAIVSVDQNGAEVLTGRTCLKYLMTTAGVAVEVPKAVRAAGAGPGKSSQPGLSKQQRLEGFLGKYAAPFHFVRLQTGSFQCFCGGKGVNQVVVADANGLEFSVGSKCAGLIPGVVIPKQIKQGSTTTGVSGLKGSVAPAAPAVPAFEQVV